jgi:phosphoribosylaminoimidazole carboxylase (NCAIR synthetase)
MINLLGRGLEEGVVHQLMSVPGVKIHWYGKNRVLPKRKMGHISVTAPTRLEVEKRLGMISEILDRE